MSSTRKSERVKGRVTPPASARPPLRVERSSSPPEAISEVLQGRSRMPPDIRRTVLLAPSEDNESTLARPKQKPAPAPAPAPARKPDFFDTTATTIDNDVDELIIGEHVEKSEAGPSEMPRRSARLSSPKNTRLSPSVDPDELQVAVSFLFLSF
jgi:hypothetical protein